MKTADAEMKDCFSRLKGQIAWGLHRGHGSALFIEFGRPHLEVREPVKASAGASRKVTELLAQRQVFPQGEWSFLVTEGDWRITVRNKRCRAGDDGQKIDAVLNALNGQKVSSILYDDKGKSVEMSFDLGGTLTVRPPKIKTDGDFWLLSDHNLGRIYAGEAGSVTGSKTTKCKPGEVVAP